MYFTGVIIGIAAFIIIGIFHPIVIKCEYYFTDRIWPVFLIIGIIAIASSCLIDHVVTSSIVGIFGCASIWSIIELKEQRERVRKGWFPKNPKRKS